MFKKALPKILDSGIHSIYITSILLLIAIIISGCSLSLSKTEDGETSPQEPPNENLSQEKTLAAGLSMVMSATVAPTMQPTKQATIDTESGSGLLQDGAVLKEIEGRAQVRQSSQGNFMNATIGYELLPNGQVKTLKLSKVLMELSDQSIIRLGPNSLLTYEGKEPNNSTGFLTQLKLDTGKLWVVLKSGSLEVETPSGVASVSGSYMSITVDPDTNTVYVTCLEGNCSLENDLGTVYLVAGQTASITNASTPPIIGYMTDVEVAEWLNNNPEATVIIPIVTLTAAAFPTKTPVTTTIHSGTIPQTTTK